MPAKLIGAVAAVAAACAFAAGPADARAAATECPGTFRVLHDDRIGPLQLPAGPYDIFVSTPQTLSCSQAENLFREFLDDPDGDLPEGWRVNARKAKFTNSRTDQAFRVRRARGGGGGGTGGGGGGNAQTGRCPGTFEVEHDDRIGRLRIPAGEYVIRVKRLSCKRASNLFRTFLNDPDGDLPGGWVVKARKAKFRNPDTNQSFRIKPA